MNTATKALLPGSRRYLHSRYFKLIFMGIEVVVNVCMHYVGDEHDQRKSNKCCYKFRTHT